MTQIPIINDPNRGPEGVRTCGDCFLCCIVLSIPPLGKPAGLRCSHIVLDEAKRTTGCCGIQTVKPALCQDFRCAWLDGYLPDEYRPDRIKGVLVSGADGNSVILHEHPRYAGVARRALAPLLDNLAMQRVPVIIVCGPERTALIRSQEVLTDVQRKLGLDHAPKLPRRTSSPDPSEDRQAPEEPRSDSRDPAQGRQQTPGEGSPDQPAQALPGHDGPATAGECPPRQEDPHD